MYRGTLANKALSNSEPEYRRLSYKGHTWEVPSDLWGCGSMDPRIEDWADSEVCPSEQPEFWAAWGRRDAFSD